MHEQSVKIESIKLLVILLSLTVTLFTANAFDVNIRNAPFIVSLLCGVASLILSYMYLISTDDIDQGGLYKSSLYFDLTFIIYLFGSLVNNFSLGIIEVELGVVPLGITTPSIVIFVSTAVMYLKFSLDLDTSLSTDVDNKKCVEICVDYSNMDENIWLVISFVVLLLFISLSSFMYHLM